MLIKVQTELNQYNGTDPVSEDVKMIFESIKDQNQDPDTNQQSIYQRVVEVTNLQSKIYNIMYKELLFKENSINEHQTVQNNQEQIDYTNNLNSDISNNNLQDSSGYNDNKQISNTFVPNSNI